VNAASTVKRQGKESIGFAGVYVATDYLRKEKEKGLRKARALCQKPVYEG
jgi:hypothetical protein